MMKIPESYYVIHQPTYRTPSVFDLHDNGRFNFRPFVTSNWGIRIIANDQLTVKMQFAELVDKPAGESTSGEKFKVMLKSVVVDLGADLTLPPESLDRHICEDSVRKEVIDAVEEWQSNFVPRDGDNNIDQTGLRKKIESAIESYKTMRRTKLAHKNNNWVQAYIPRKIQDFRQYIYPLANGLHDRYTELGGKEDEAGLIRKIVTIQRIYDGDNEAGDNLLKPNGGQWQDDDEIWECWIGFAGSEAEARRIGKTLLDEFVPLREKGLI